MSGVLARNWGWIAFRGVLAVIFGVLTLSYPGITIVLFVFWFGAYALVDGAAMIVSAITNRHGQPRWGILLLGGFLSVGVGILTFTMPGMTAVLLLTLIAVWAIITGAAEIVAAVRLRKEIAGEWMLVLAGVLGVAFGLLLLASPRNGAIAMALWIGAYAIVTGIVLIGLGFRLRNWGRHHHAYVVT